MAYKKIESRTWLVLDSNFLCWRAFHVFQDLNHQDVRTGVVYGFLRDVSMLQDRFNTPHVVFCFDGGTANRERLLPSYKQARRNRTPEEQKLREGVRKQIDALRDVYLYEIGYRNVLRQTGYEADDLIAAFCTGSVTPRDRCVIVSADQDLYQCLSGSVSLFNPKGFKETTLQSFYAEKGILPNQWPTVKALAGCTSDNIPGVGGVGEVYAVRHLRGELDPLCKAARTIAESGDVIARNHQLVKLPFPGTKTFSPRPDEVSAEKWRALADRLGMKSLRNAAPFPARMRRTV